MQQLSTNIKPHFLKRQSNGIIRYATLPEIVYLKADNNSTCLILNDLSMFIMCQTLQSFETMLENQFYRCHKSYLVNTKYIREINKRNHAVILTTGEMLPFSRKKAKALEEKLKIKTA